MALATKRGQRDWQRLQSFLDTSHPLLESSTGGGNTLTNLSDIVKELGKERDRLDRQLSGLNAALEAFAGVYRGTNGTKPRRKISAKGRASIAAAQTAPWPKGK